VELLHAISLLLTLEWRSQSWRHVNSSTVWACAAAVALRLHKKASTPMPPWLPCSITTRSYYTSEIHGASFVLPKYAHDALKDSLTHA
jgi:spermidine synthase